MAIKLSVKGDKTSVETDDPGFAGICGHEHAYNNRELISEMKEYNIKELSDDREYPFADLKQKLDEKCKERGYRW